MKNKSTNEKRLPDQGVQSRLPTATELSPPSTNGVEVQERVTKATIVDIQRYLNWAEKLLGAEKDTKGRTPNARQKVA